MSSSICCPPGATRFSVAVSASSFAVMPFGSVFPLKRRSAIRLLGSLE